MKKFRNHVSLPMDQNSKISWLWSILPTACLLCLVFFIGSAFIATDYKQKISRLGIDEQLQNNQSDICKKISRIGIDEHVQNNQTDICKNHSKPYGSESLPKGIIVKTSNLEMQPLYGSRKKQINATMNLFAIAAGIKQKENVNEMVKKFLSSNFVVQLFHYDGVVDEWNDLEWYHRVIHVSALNQTKWWFAKRYLHPDIVAAYDYIFLWDEDLGVENFDPSRYLTVVDEEGLEISQPALDPVKSELHHQITIRWRRTKVHRRFYKKGLCNDNSTEPPCTGFVEMMAPVFSRAAWRCTWFMIQNDLIHAWGLDKKLGYCAQGDRTKNVGIVDSEYIVHQGLPTLGSSDEGKTPHNGYDDRMRVRKQSYDDQREFNRRWKAAANEDECWVNPYQKPTNISSQ